MASCVGQAQGAHRSRLEPSRLRADGIVGCPCATDECSHNKGIWGVGPSPGGGNRPAVQPNGLGIPCIKENQMKRIDVWSGMRERSTDNWLIHRSRLTHNLKKYAMSRCKNKEE